MLAARPRPVCYVLERESQTDLAILNDVCGKFRLPRPTRRLLIAGRRADRAYFELERRAGLFGGRIDPRPPRYLYELLAAVAARPDFDVDLVPVAIFWGRAAQKEPSWWRLPFTENWVIAGRRARRMLTVPRERPPHPDAIRRPAPLREAMGDGGRRRARAGSRARCARR